MSVSARRYASRTVLWHPARREASCTIGRLRGRSGLINSPDSTCTPRPRECVLPDKRLLFARGNLITCRTHRCFVFGAARLLHSVVVLCPPPGPLLSTVINRNRVLFIFTYNKVFVLSTVNLGPLNKIRLLDVIPGLNLEP